MKNDNRKILAIMFADIAGYSKMMGNNEYAAIKLLENYKAIVEPIIEEHSGKIIKWLGDGFFCQFSSAFSSVNCSLELQSAFNKYNEKRQQEEFPLNVRIGIHLGDVIQKDNDLFGDGVNVASRIEPKAPKNGICITGSVYRAISSHPHFNVSPIGKIPLKNIKIEHELYLVKTGYEQENINIKIVKNKKKKRIVAFFVLLIIVFLMKFGYDNFYKTTSIYDNSVEDIKKTGNINNLSLANIVGKEGVDLYTNLKKAKTKEAVFLYLNEEKKQLKLIYGKKDDFFEQDGKYVVLIRNGEFSYLIFVKDNKYINVANGKSYYDLKSRFKDYAAIWIELVK